MSNTYSVSVSPIEGWKLILSGTKKGIFSIGKGAQFCQSDVIPDASIVGHRHNGFLIGFDIPVSSGLYVKSDTQLTNVVITEE